MAGWSSSSIKYRSAHSAARRAAEMGVKVVNFVNSYVSGNGSIVQGGDTGEFLAFKEFKACATAG